MDSECIYCKGVVSAERVNIGRHYCMSKTCLDIAAREWAQGIRYVLVPKQGFTFVRANDPALKQGRSSGR